MNAENIQPGSEAGDTKENAENRQSNLLKFDDNTTSTPAKDINSKITSLDTDLAQLRAELVTINNSVEEGLDRLGDTDTDLTAKVSETYKRLGEIDNAYKALLEISSRIDYDIQKLNGDVSSVAEQSATGIKTLEQSTIAQSHEFTQKNQQVASKVNQLVETSKLTSELLRQKIQSTTENMLSIEKNVIAEIDRLADVTKEKTDSLQNTISSNKASILKLQSVDEAIIRRATTLEISSAELTAKSQQLDASIDQLNISTDSLQTSLHELRQRTLTLEEVTARQGTLIGGLQKTTSEITDRLAALTGRESRHFNIVTTGFVLLLVITAVIYFAQQSQFDTNAMLSAERNVHVDNQVANLQQIQASNNQQTATSLAVLESKINQVDDAMKTVQDQVQSVEARFNQSAPFSEIGNDNIIHGAQWIADLPADNYSVQMAFVDNKSALYETAQSYNSYLKDALSYFEVNANGATKYVLLSGNYPDQQQAKAAIADMPRYINQQQPVVRKLELVQKYIADNKL